MAENTNPKRAAIQERRKPRYSANLSVMVFTKGLNHFQSERTANISSGGLFICTDYKCDIGEKLHIRVMLADIDSYFDVKTRVAWTCGADQSHPEGMGLEFTELNEAQQKVIKEILTNYINIKER